MLLFGVVGALALHTPAPLAICTCSRDQPRSYRCEYRHCRHSRDAFLCWISMLDWS